MNEITKYFPNLTALQREQFERLKPLYEEWNAKINVISRRDMEHFYERHVLHSLAIARVCPFPDGARIMDVGTGGGFPGIPLAIMFPQAKFWLVDSIGKKIAVVRGVAQTLGLTNVVAVNARAETVAGKFDWVVSRAVTDMKTFLTWVDGKINHGILYLKGGDLTVEMQNAARPYTLYNIADLFAGDFFTTKHIVRIDY